MRKLSLALLLLVSVLSWSLSWGATPRPKLIVMMVIDQFRGDYLTRFQSRFLPAHEHGEKGKVGGFNYLMTAGAYYPYGQYDILQSMTGPGHATVLSGAYPYQAGIPSNDWYSNMTHDYMYCVEDPAFSWVGVDKTPAHAGTSPKNYLASTVGDELKNAGYPSRVVSLALKDRAAILMGGKRADLAFWFDPASFQWVSSNFYLPNKTLPLFLDKLNLELKNIRGKRQEWQPKGPGTGYSAQDAQPWSEDGNVAKVGKDFPHVSEIGTKASLLSPLGTDLTETAAERAIQAFDLGHGKSTDLLAVSFSSHDYVGHAFGPNSREMEEMTISEDRGMAKLLNFIDQKVGLKNVVLVLTGDHGMAPNPDYALANKEPAGRIDEDNLAKEIIETLNQIFGPLPAAQKWILMNHDFSYFLNLGAIEKKGIKLADVEASAKQILLQDPGTAFVVTSTEYAARKLPPGMHERQVMHTFYPGRSPQLLLIPRPFFIPAAGDTDVHITGYSYDRTVPIILAGPGIQPGTYSTRAEVIDIAPTLTFLSGTVAPNLSEGRVLSEILGK